MRIAGRDFALELSIFVAAQPRRDENHVPDDKMCEDTCHQSILPADIFDELCEGAVATRRSNW
jgi:hypothetical protein